MANKTSELFEGLKSNYYQLIKDTRVIGELIKSTVMKYFMIFMFSQEDEWWFRVCAQSFFWL